MKYLERARKTGIKTHLLGAITIAGFFTALYGYYAYSFFVGSFLITEKVSNSITGKTYTSGDIMSCYLGLVYGIFSLAIVAPNFKALTEARIAGKMAYDIIEKKPSIMQNNSSGKEIEEIKG